MDSNIACSAARYEFGEDIGVEFDPDRLSLSLKFRNDTILETVASIPLALSKNGFGENISCVKSVDSTCDGMTVAFETERGNAVAIHISSRGGGLRVKISSPGADRYRRIGINFAIPDGDQWYGADIMASTSWPLNANAINRDAWLSTDNQTSPIWLSSRGTSVYVKDYQSLGFQFHGLVRDSLSVYAMGFFLVRVQCHFEREYPRSVSPDDGSHRDSAKGSAFRVFSKTGLLLVDKFSYRRYAGRHSRIHGGDAPGEFFMRGLYDR